MAHQLTEQGREDFRLLVKFARHLMASRDIDPLYPIMENMIEEQEMDLETALWFTFLYVAWYNLPSAYAAFLACPEPRKRVLELDGARWPTGIERRSNRGGVVFKHIADYLEKVEYYGDQLTLYTNDDLDINSPVVGKNDHVGWHIVNHQIQSIWGNGRWAAYKHCEILRRVNGFPIAAPDMGHQFSSGPREGLEMLYGPIRGEGAAAIQRLNDYSEDFLRRLSRKGVEADIEEGETILCNYKSLAKGKYYVGHDVDELQEQIELSVEDGRHTARRVQPIYNARMATIPSQYLGELNGWHGVDKKRMKAFRDRRKILIRRPKEN